MIDETNYVDRAEAAIIELKNKAEEKGKGKGYSLVTTSQIRNLLAMVSDIYNDVIVTKDEKLSTEMVGRINYMKLRFYYEAGRTQSVKDLLMTAKVFDIIKNIGDSKNNYILFSRYMEALVAFHRYHGGKDM